MKKISLPKVLSVLVITFLAFAFSFVLPFVGVYVADADQDFYENFESYALGNAAASGLTEKWDISSVTGNDRTEIKTDPENENNKVLSIRSIATDDYYYFLSPKALRMKNFEISFKVWFVDTHIKNGWIAVACRKETNVKYDSTKCALLTLNNNSNKRDAMEYQPLTFDGDIKNVMTDIDNGITYGIDKTFVYERWYDFTIVVQDDAFTAYFDGKDLGTGYTDALSDSGYISFNVGQNEVLVDDITIKNQERYSIAVSVDGGCINGGVAESNRKSTTDREVTLTATANEGYEFDGWYNGTVCVSDSPEYSFMPTEDVDFKAKFIPKSYNLSVTVDGNGTANGEGVYETDEQLVLTAIPDAGSVFVGWFSEIGKLSSELSFNYTMVSRDMEIKALFVVADTPKYSVELNNIKTVKTKVGDDYVINYVGGDEMGQAEGAGDFYRGEPVTIKANSVYGYEFAGWYNDDELVSENETYRFICEKDVTYRAIFRVKTYVLKVVNGIGGKATEYRTEAGNLITVVPKAPTAGYYFSGWVINVSYEQDKDGVIKFVMPENDITVRAVYSEKTYVVTIKSDGVNGVIGGGNKTVGEQVVCSVFIEKGYKLLGYNVTGAEGVLTEDGSLVFTMPANDVNVEVVLTKSATFPYGATVTIGVIAVLAIAAIVIYNVRAAKGEKKNG